MRILVGTVAIFTALACMSANAQQNPCAKALEEMGILERDLSVMLAPIRTEAALRKYLASPQSNSPFAPLSQGARTRFVQSLRFSEKGLSGYEYGDLQQELTATQIYRILSLFGVETSTSAIPGLKVQSKSDELILLRGKLYNTTLRAATDYPGYICGGKASCIKDERAICIGANC